MKAVAGGGGKGMRTVGDPADLCWRGSRGAIRRLAPAFGDAAVYLERQSHEAASSSRCELLADEHGTVVPFVERECSIQRRHQKVVEETPSGASHSRRCGQNSPPRRRRSRARSATPMPARLSSCSTRTARSYFLEMNTRLQVEHAASPRMVTGVDLVRWQIRIARGERLDLDAVRMLVSRGSRD